MYRDAAAKCGRSRWGTLGLGLRAPNPPEFGPYDTPRTAKGLGVRGWVEPTVHHSNHVSPM